MKILLVAPARKPCATPRKGSLTRFPPISLLYVAGLTPSGHEVSLVEEEFLPIDFDADCDLVGITSMTANAPRAYLVADEFRRRGRKVVMGGVHPSVMPEEAKAHCDAVVIGEAEPVWNELLDDAEEGRLKSFYRGGTDWDLDQTPLPSRNTGIAPAALGVAPVVTSRGCPYACEFCCVRNLFGPKIRHVGIARVLEDIERTGSSRVMFLDDNIVGDQAYAARLFAALVEAKIQWVGQASISFVRNAKLLDLAARSGCKGLFVGVESVSESRIERMNKGMRNLRDTADAIARIMGKGILFHASIVFGFDDDDTSIFDRTLEFLGRTRVPSATFNILTPYPGTVIYDQFQKERRLLTTDWRDFNHSTPTFMPRRMSVEELSEGFLRVRRSYFGLGSIVRRFPASWRTPLLFALLNLGLREGRREERETMRKHAADLQVAHERPQVA
ncbi:MAG: B12-binding domain-containing radical SAM protein [Acidobacteria bacterium]|nr:B12-binding domain-containing radical SAM protein [Acidobacteriota bacterium]